MKANDVTKSKTVQNVTIGKQIAFINFTDGTSVSIGVIDGDLSPMAQIGDYDKPKEVVQLERDCMLNPTQRFVVSAITRSGLAAELNQYHIDATGEKAANPFTPGDDRLTDEICQLHADRVLKEQPEPDGDGGDQESEDTRLHDIWRKLGIDIEGHND